MTQRGMPVASGIVGGNICLATGSALASQIKKDNIVTLSIFGDGATNIGFFHEALNMASVWNLPIIFLCENNQYAEATHREQHQKIERISDRAIAYSMPGKTVDGTDVLKVYEAVKEAVESIHRGEGPILIECVAYRLSGHSSGDLGLIGQKEKWKNGGRCMTRSKNIKQSSLRKIYYLSKKQKKWNKRFKRR